VFSAFSVRGLPVDTYTEGVGFMLTFANVTVFDTDVGLVLVDCGAVGHAKSIYVRPLDSFTGILSWFLVDFFLELLLLLLSVCLFIQEDLKVWRPNKAIHTVIYTHGHVDHCMGVRYMEKTQIGRSHFQNYYYYY
jgi:glyoxylase-like metal-dependent hydrolase (beta-lactamase superfamily II)